MLQYLAKLSRRELLSSLFVGVLAMVLGCQKPKKRSPVPVRIADLSELQSFRTPFPLKRVEVLRSGKRLRCVSLVCSHQQCLLEPVRTGYHCPCHGAAFDTEGEVLKGPANTPLQWFKLSVKENELYAHFFEPVDASWALTLDESEQ